MRGRGCVLSRKYYGPEVVILGYPQLTREDRGIDRGGIEGRTSRATGQRNACCCHWSVGRDLTDDGKALCREQNLEPLRNVVKLI